MLESCGHHTSYKSSLGVTNSNTNMLLGRLITNNNAVILSQADMTVTTTDRIIGTREWAGRLRFIRYLRIIDGVRQGRRGREGRKGGKNPFEFLLCSLCSEIRLYSFEINISESDHMTYTLRVQDLKSSLFLVDPITFLTHDNCQCLYLSIVCRHNALGCQGKQHLSVINRVTAWKEEALGLILISLPRSELGRCWTGSSSLSPHPHPPSV